MISAEGSPTTLSLLTKTRLVAPSPPACPAVFFPRPFAADKGAVASKLLSTVFLLLLLPG